MDATPGSIAPKAPAMAKLSTKLKTPADVGPNASKAKPGAKPRPKPSASNGAKPGTTGVKHHAANVNPSAAHPKPGGVAKPPQAGAAAGSKPNAASIQTVSVQLDAVHQKTIQSIYEADMAMSAARADLERAKASKEDRNKVVLMANQVAAALLAPSRQVVQLLAGHGVLFPPCKQVSKALSTLLKAEAGRQGSDVRVALVHFDLARALAQFGALSRKSRPTISLGDHLNEVSKRFYGLIEEFGKFCEVYYENKAPGSRIKHLMRWNSNKDSLNGFALRIAGLKSDLGGLLSQQATQQPWQHADALAQIESRVVSNRGFYATIHDADEDVAHALASKNGGGSDVQIDGALVKQLAGAVGEGLVQGFASALKGMKAKQPQKAASGKTSFGSKLQNSMNKFTPGSQQKPQAHPKPHPKPASHEPTHSHGGKTIEHNDSVSAGDELYEEQYIWEYEDIGGELGDDDVDPEYYLQEDRDIDGDDGDQDADLQEGGEDGPRLDGDNDSGQQENLQEGEEAEGEQGECGVDREVHLREGQGVDGNLGESNDEQEPDLQGSEDSGNESGGDSGSEGDGGSGSGDDGDQGPHVGGGDSEQADSDVDQEGGYSAQDSGDDSDSGW